MDGRTVAVVAAVAASLALGFALGRRSWKASTASEQPAPAFCACGACLKGFTTNSRRLHLGSARHRRNLRLINRSAHIVVAENWSEYRSCITSLIASSDIVLEVGCGNGVTTSLLSQSAARAIGVDMSEALITEAKERFPHIEWHAMDARVVAPLRKLAPFSAIFIDLNGSREMETLLPMIDAYEAVLRPALIVVKSNKLKHLIHKCSSVNQLSERKQPTPSMREVHSYRQYRRSCVKLEP